MRFLKQKPSLPKNIIDRFMAGNPTIDISIIIIFIIFKLFTKPTTFLMAVLALSCPESREAGPKALTSPVLKSSVSKVEINNYNDTKVLDLAWTVVFGKGEARASYILYIARDDDAGFSETKKENRHSGFPEWRSLYHESDYTLNRKCMMSPSWTT